MHMTALKCVNLSRDKSNDKFNGTFISEYFSLICLSLHGNKPILLGVDPLALP
jgi:hypothetical protein